MLQRKSKHTFYVQQLFDMIYLLYGMEMKVEKNKNNENFKTTITSKNYDKPKTTRECGIF